MASDYRESVDSIAEEAKRSFPDPVGQRDDRERWITESVEGSQWIIYTANHEEVLDNTDNEPDDDEVRAMAGDDVSWRDMRQAAALLAMERDVKDALQKLDDESPYVDPDFAVGDRIRLVSMERKRGKAVAPGTEGTVTSRARKEISWVYHVDWDSGSRLVLTVPPDEAEFA